MRNKLTIFEAFGLIAKANKYLEETTRFSFKYKYAAYNWSDNIGWLVTEYIEAHLNGKTVNGLLFSDMLDGRIELETENCIELLMLEYFK